MAAPVAHSGCPSHDHHDGAEGLAAQLALTEREQAQWLGFGVILFVGGMVAELAGGRPEIAEVCFWVSTLAAGWTFVADIVARPSSVATLMAAGAAGAVLLGAAHEAATLTVLFALSEFVVHQTFGRTQGELRGLLDLVPRHVTVLRDGLERSVPVADLLPGELMVVRPGERLATDGVVVRGSSSVDLSTVTGEPLPVEVHPGSVVYAAGMNGGGALVVEATSAGSNNSVSRLVEILTDARHRRGASELLVDRVARRLIAGAVALSGGSLAVGALTGDFSTWAYRALLVLVAMSPCALAIAVPVSVLAAIGAAGRHGVLIKGGAVLEALSRCRVVALDKTGTLTVRNPRVVEVVPVAGVSDREVLATAAALEARADHPLAAAVLAAAPSPPEVADDVTAVPGRGLTGSLAGAPVRLGNPRYVDPGPLGAEAVRLEDAGATVVVVEREGRAQGLIAVRDELRPEAAEAVEGLLESGIDHVAMLTGDNRRTADALGAASGIADIRAGLLPEDKVAAVGELSRRGPVLMVGDGINDAPALAAAEAGIAMGAMGTDLAVDAAGAALLGTDLRQVVGLCAFARRSQRIIRQQLFCSALVVAGLVPLAVTGRLSLAVAVVVHELSGTLVVLAGLRAGRADALARRQPIRTEPQPEHALSPTPMSLTPRRAAIGLTVVALAVAAAGVAQLQQNRPDAYISWLRAAEPLVDEAFAIDGDHLEVAAGEDLRYELDCIGARLAIDRVAGRMPVAPDEQLNAWTAVLFAELRQRYQSCAVGDMKTADAAYATAQRIRRQIDKYTLRKTGGGHVH